MSAVDLTPSLVLKLRAGDTHAGELLEALYRDAVARFVLGYVGDPSAAEDVVQEVFVKVLEADTVPDRFRPWLYRIARNHCLNHLRARRGRADTHLSTDLAGAMSQTGHLSKLVAEEESARLAQAIESLSLEHREVLRLRYGDELSREEIAEVLELSVSVVKSRLYEGLKKLRSAAG